MDYFDDVFLLYILWNVKDIHSNVEVQLGNGNQGLTPVHDHPVDDWPLKMCVIEPSWTA